MGRTKELLEKLHYGNLSEMHFLEQERPFLTHFSENTVDNTTEENKPLKSNENES